MLHNQADKAMGGFLAHSRWLCVSFATTGPVLAVAFLAARFGLDAMSDETVAATAALGTETAADDDVELEAAAADGNAVLDACSSCTSVTFATFLALVFKPLEPDIAKARKEAASKDKSCRDDELKEELHERLEPKVGYGKKKQLEAAEGVGGTPSNGRTNERTTRTAKDEHTTGKHPAPTHRTGHQAHSSMIYNMCAARGGAERKNTYYILFEPLSHGFLRTWRCWWWLRVGPVFGQD
jgi:hypothetical protein